MSEATDDGALASTLDSLDGAANYTRWILDLVRPALAAPILEVGAGHGTFTAGLAEIGRVDALEPGRLGSAALAQRFAGDARVTVVCGVVDDLATDAQYGSAVMINVLEHIEDDVGVLHDIRARMIGGARIAIWVPAFPLLYSRFDRRIGHHRRYRKAGIRRVVEDAGFRVVDLRYVNAPGFVMWLLITRLLRQAPTAGRLVTVFDRLVVPVVRRIESVVPPPFGQSLLLIAANDGMIASEDSRAPGAPQGRPSAVTLLGAAAVLAVLVTAAMARGLRATNADSLLTGLISTQRLTAFYWGQDRLASVVPALAWPIQQVTWNHLAQTALITASFFVLIGSFVRFHAARTNTPTTWPLLVVSTLVTGGLVLVILTRTSTYVLILEQQYALSTVVFLGGLAALGRDSWRWRLAGGAALVIATSIIPSSVLLAPAVLVTQRQGARRPRWAAIGTTALLAFALASLASRALAPDVAARSDYTRFSVGRLADGFGTAIESIGHSVHLSAAAPAAAGCVAVLVARRRSFPPALQLVYALCPLVAVGWVALFSANAWVETNQFAFRYFFLAYAAGTLVLAGATTEACAWVWGQTRPDRTTYTAPLPLAAVASAAVLLAGAAVVARTDIPAVDAGEALAAEAERNGADMVVGDYWRSWPAAFASRAAGDDLLAAAPRAEVLRDEFLRRAGRDGSLTAYCLGDDAPSCVNDLNLATQTPWELVSVRSVEPLVIEVTADA